MHSIYGISEIGKYKLVDIVCKLKLNDIVDIYDTCTALTKDGKIVSLLQDNEEDTSAVQELQKQTDKYLVASHLGLKDGKLYNFENVKEGVEVTAGKIVQSDTQGLGIYSENTNTIKIFNKDKYNNVLVNSLIEGECYIDVEAISEELPEFVDIAEYRDTYLTRLAYSVLIESGNYKDINYNESDKYVKCLALTKEGQIWAYIGGYIVDTGINLDFFGPTANYNLDNTKWTNGNIIFKITANTTNEIVSAQIRKGEETLSTLNKEQDQKLEEKTLEITVNGKYNIEITDAKGRSYTSNFNVSNIDKLKPITPEIEKKDGKVQVIFKDDSPATDKYAKSGIKERLISYDGANWTKVEDDIVTIELTKSATIYAKSIDNAGNESDITKQNIDVDIGKVIVKYQDEEGNTLKEDLTITGNVGENYKVEKAEIDIYELLEVIGNEEGKYTKEDQVVIYKYKKIEGRIIIIYEDPEGNKIQENTIMIGKVGEPYKIDRQTIDGYELIEVIGNEEGKYKVEDQYVRYKYKKLEIPTIPQTGQGRIGYLIVGIVIIICMSTLIYYNEAKN